MDVRSAVPRAGARSSSLTAHQQVGQIEIEDITVNPDPVLPNGFVTVTVDLVERASFVGPLDPDLCNPPGVIQTTGLQTLVEVDPSWTTGDDNLVCVPVFNTTEGRASVEFSFPAPSVEGTYPIQICVSLPGSDKGPECTQVTVMSRSDGLTGCRTDADCEGDKECVEGECRSPGGGDGGGPGDILGMVAIVLGLLIVLFGLGQFS